MNFNALSETHYDMMTQVSIKNVIKILAEEKMSKSYNADTSNAFVSTCEILPYQSGILDNMTFAVKDNIDVAGLKTSYGSKPWVLSHPPAVGHAVCVEQLLNAGARCIGKTISDELTCSLAGENFFYGTPINPNAPDRIPGGSSSGSAFAVACGLVDFALGTDSAGSIRVPASHCGVLGMRPTLHRISESGLLPFAPSTSTVGVFAKNLTILEKTMSVLLASEDTEQQAVKKIYLLEDAFSLADAEINQALRDYMLLLGKIKNIEISFVTLSDIIGEPTNLSIWQKDIFSINQRVEIWNAVGAWMEDTQPEMSEKLKTSLETCKIFDRSTLSHALKLREKMFLKTAKWMKPNDLICFPTVPTIAPLKGELDNPEKSRAYHSRAINITAFASVAKLPEISIPVTKINNVPLGLSLVGAHRQDEFLLDAAKQLFDGFI